MPINQVKSVQVMLRMVYSPCDKQQISIFCVNTQKLVKTLDRCETFTFKIRKKACQVRQVQLN